MAACSSLVVDLDKGDVSLCLPCFFLSGGIISVGSYEGGASIDPYILQARQTHWNHTAGFQKLYILFQNITQTS